MADVWGKLDGYTKSDHLNSSDDDEDEEGFQELLQKVDNATIVAKKKSTTKAISSETSGDLHTNLLSEMKESKLHYDTESRHVQEKIDEISSEKKNQKGELSEMHHKAQVISKSARMSATDVLWTITSSETMDMEENRQTGEYLDKIRSVETETSVSFEKQVEVKSSSSDIDLPDIPPVSTTILNTGVMKSRANVVRQGSMKARRKPTHRKSWTPGTDHFSLTEKATSSTENTTADSSNLWILPLSGNSVKQEPGTPSDSSSSEDEKEQPTKPHFKSGVALPGLFDVDKIQLQKSELKRPTALTLVKSAKDAKENQVTKEDKPDVPVSKPDWMKEVEKRKRDPKTTRRRHVTLPARCSELDKLFEQRRHELPEGMTPVTSQDDGGIVRGESRPVMQGNDNVDPQLRKLFEKRRQLKPMEDVVSDKEPTRPKSMHLENTPSELDQIFEKRRALKPVEDVPQGESSTLQQVPQNGHGIDTKDGAAVYPPRQQHNGPSKLEPLTVNSSEMKIAKISNVRSHDGSRTSLVGTVEVSSVGRCIPSNTGGPTDASQIVQFTPDMSGGTRATVGRIPSTGTPVAASHVQFTPNIMTSGKHAAVGRIPSADTKTSTKASKVVQFTPDISGGAQATVGHIPSAATPDMTAAGTTVGCTPSSGTPQEASQVVQFAPGMSGGRHATVCRTASAGMQRPPSRLGHNVDRAVVARYEEQSYMSTASIGSTSASQETPKTSIEYSVDRSRQTATSHGSGRKRESPRNDSVNVVVVEQIVGLQNSRSSYSNMVSRVTVAKQVRPVVTKSSHSNHPQHPHGNSVCQSPYTPSPNSHPNKHHTLPPMTHPHPPSIQKNRLFMNTSDIYTPSPPAIARIRNVSSPVRKPALPHHDPFMSIENRLSENGLNSSKKAATVSHITPELHHEPSYKRLSNGHIKPVTVTATSITETPVWVRVAQQSGGRDESLGRGGEKPNHDRDIFVHGNSTKYNTQITQSPNSDVPQWKLELQQKKRLQAEKQKKLSDKENIKTLPSQESDVAEWQKRLQGIRKKWGNNTPQDDTMKDSNDNVTHMDDTLSQNDSDSGATEAPAFLREFQAKKMKQKVKVTVTAKSTPDNTEKTSVADEDAKSSSKHSTYV